MQGELDSESPQNQIVILGVNQVGSEPGNPTMVSGRSLPWLQELAEHDVWEDWGATLRDAFLVDRDNHLVDVVNLTANDLSVPANYDALKAQLLDIAAR
jgi:hypothetical protein